MEFNLQQFLVENKLTKRSLLSEDVPGTKSEEGSEEEMYGDESEDSWYKDDSGDSEEFEKEPVAKDVKSVEPSVGSLQKKQVDLRTLEDQKDALLMQLKSGQLSLDQYKAAIGNIPAQIKKLRADIEQALRPSVEDDDTEDVV